MRQVHGYIYNGLLFSLVHSMIDSPDLERGLCVYVRAIWSCRLHNSPARSQYRISVALVCAAATRVWDFVLHLLYEHYSLSYLSHNFHTNLTRSMSPDPVQDGCTSHGLPSIRNPIPVSRVWFPSILNMCPGFYAAVGCL
jgi:hypothetical protein